MICPYNFVKTKLKLETMSPWQVLVVHLDDGDSHSQCPPRRSNEGHDILSQGKAEQSYRLVIRKRLDD